MDSSLENKAVVYPSLADFLKITQLTQYEKKVKKLKCVETEDLLNMSARVGYLHVEEQRMRRYFDYFRQRSLIQAEAKQQPITLDNFFRISNLQHVAKQVTKYGVVEFDDLSYMAYADLEVMIPMKIERFRFKRYIDKILKSKPIGEIEEEQQRSAGSLKNFLEETKLKKHKSVFEKLGVLESDDVLCLERSDLLKLSQVEFDRFDRHRKTIVPKTEHQKKESTASLHNTGLFQMNAVNISVSAIQVQGNAQPLPTSRTQQNQNPPPLPPKHTQQPQSPTHPPQNPSPHVQPNHQQPVPFQHSQQPQPPTYPQQSFPPQFQPQHQQVHMPTPVLISNPEPAQYNQQPQPPTHMPQLPISPTRQNENPPPLPFNHSQQPQSATCPPQNIPPHFQPQHQQPHVPPLEPDLYQQSPMYPPQNIPPHFQPQHQQPHVPPLGPDLYQQSPTYPPQNIPPHFQPQHQQPHVPPPGPGLYQQQSFNDDYHGRRVSLEQQSYLPQVLPRQTIGFETQQPYNPSFAPPVPPVERPSAPAWN